MSDLSKQITDLLKQITDKEEEEKHRQQRMATQTKFTELIFDINDVLISIDAKLKHFECHDKYLKSNKIGPGISVAERPKQQGILKDDVKDLLEQLDLLYKFVVSVAELLNQQQTRLKRLSNDDS